MEDSGLRFVVVNYPVAAGRELFDCTRLLLIAFGSATVPSVVFQNVPEILFKPFDVIPVEIKKLS
jgi:hypothetical protein